MDLIAPSNKFLDDSGGSLVFTVPLSAPHEIAPLFRLIDSGNDEFKYDHGSDSYTSEDDPNITELKKLV